MRASQEPACALEWLDLRGNDMGGPRGCAALCRGLRAHPNPTTLRFLATDFNLGELWRDLGLEEVGRFLIR